MSNNDPAFPLNELNHVTGDLCAQQFGLSLRDYFAAHATDADVDALRGLVPKCSKISSDGPGIKWVVRNIEPDNWRTVARYMHADNMLAYRTGPNV